MYMDWYVASGLIIVGLTCGILGYMGYHFYKHIKHDIEEHPGE